MGVEEGDAGRAGGHREVSGLDVGGAHLRGRVALGQLDGLGAEGGDDLGGFLRGAGLTGFELGDLGLQLGGFQGGGFQGGGQFGELRILGGGFDLEGQIGRASCRERV